MSEQVVVTRYEGTEVKEVVTSDDVARDAGVDPDQAARVMWALERRHLLFGSVRKKVRRQ